MADENEFRAPSFEFRVGLFGMTNPKPETRNPKPRRTTAAAGASAKSNPKLQTLNSKPVPRLDRIIHERIRLAIVSSLAANEMLSFNELKHILQTTDGNLSVHARKLEEAGYVSCTKSFEKRMPKTRYRLTAEGRRAFVRYVGHLEALIAAAGSR